MGGRARAWVAEQGPLGCLAWGLLLVAAVASWEHGVQVARDHGQTGLAVLAIALLPDLLAWGALQKLRTEVLGGGGQFVVVVVLFVAGAWTLLANLATAAPGGGRRTADDVDRVMAMAPVVGAILAMLLAEIRGERKTRTVVESPPTSAPAGDVLAFLEEGDERRAAAAETSRPARVTAVADDDQPRGRDATDEQLLDAARATLERPISGNALRHAFGVGARRAGRLADVLAADPEGHGHG